MSNLSKLEQAVFPRKFAYISHDFQLGRELPRSQNVYSEPTLVSIPNRMTDMIKDHSRSDASNFLVHLADYISCSFAQK